WFSFSTANTPCGTADYTGWFGFDSLPVLTKTRSDVQSYFRDVARYWLRQGAAGWRFDVSGDPSFPNGYWEAMRQAISQVDPNALTISETWQKDSTLLRMIRGDRLDTAMNYRLRDAVLAVLARGPFDPKGFADSGHTISSSQFAARLASIQEDYARAAFYSAMNLLDSHDTARLLWTMTPGSDTRADKEQNAANVAAGKQRVKLASLIQFGLPGAPTVYYGDEVGLTGADDPDDRRTYPWPDAGGHPDTTVYDHYRSLAQLRRDVPALTSGDFRVLLTDNAAGTVAFGRKTSSSAAIVAINRSDSTQSLDIPVGGYLPDGTSFQWHYGGTGSASVSGGTLHVTLDPLSGALLATGTVDLAPPVAPAGLHVTSEGNGAVSLAWSPVAGAS